MEAIEKTTQRTKLDVDPRREDDETSMSIKKKEGSMMKKIKKYIYIYIKWQQKHSASDSGKLQGCSCEEIKEWLSILLACY